MSVKLQADDWLCKKMKNLNLTITEGYPARNSETAGLLKDQFIKPPRLSRLYGMHTEKRDCDNVTVCSWSPVCRSEERHSSGQSHRRQGCFHPYAPSDRSASQPDRKSGNPAWKQIRDRQQAKKSHGKPSTFSQKLTKGSKQRK